MEVTSADIICKIGPLHRSFNTANADSAHLAVATMEGTNKVSPDNACPIDSIQSNIGPIELIDDNTAAVIPASGWYLVLTQVGIRIYKSESHAVRCDLVINDNVEGTVATYSYYQISSYVFDNNKAITPTMSYVGFLTEGDTVKIVERGNANTIDIALFFFRLV